MSVRRVQTTLDTNALIAQRVRWRFYMPDDFSTRTALRGILAFWGFSSTWKVDEGLTTPEESSQVFQDIVYSLSRDTSMIGAVIATLADPLPPELLLADGGTYTKADYPYLWEALPASRKTANDFTLPDLTDKFILSSGLAYPEDSAGGETDHTLNELEMPNHSHTNLTPHVHSEIIPVSSFVNGGIEAPAPSAFPSPSVTGGATITIDPTGGGQAHNNMPPYYALRYAVVTI